MSDLYCMKPPAGLYQNNKNLTNWGIQPKLDGFRCVFIPEGKTFKPISPNGKPLYNLQHIIDELVEHGVKSVIDGELLGKDWNYTAHIVRASKKARDGSSIKLYCFDMIDLKEFTSRNFVTKYSDRYNNYTKQLAGLKTVECVKMDKAKDDANVWTMAGVFLGQGYEGAVIKNLDGVYKCGRSQDIQRLKFTDTVDLIINGLFIGEGKHSNRLGYVTCDMDGVEIKVGSGFDDETREKIWKNKVDYINKCIEIKFQEKTVAGSLRFPTFVRFRDDK